MPREIFPATVRVRTDANNSFHQSKTASARRCFPRACALFWLGSRQLIEHVQVCTYVCTIMCLKDSSGAPSDARSIEGTGGHNQRSSRFSVVTSVGLDVETAMHLPEFAQVQPPSNTGRYSGMRSGGYPNTGLIDCSRCPSKTLNGNDAGRVSRDTRN